MLVHLARASLCCVQTVEGGSSWVVVRHPPGSKMVLPRKELLSLRELHSASDLCYIGSLYWLLRLLKKLIGYICIMRGLYADR